MSEWRKDPDITLRMRRMFWNCVLAHVQRYIFAKCGPQKTTENDTSAKTERPNEERTNKWIKNTQTENKQRTNKEVANSERANKKERANKQRANKQRTNQWRENKQTNRNCNKIATKTAKNATLQMLNRFMPSGFLLEIYAPVHFQKKECLVNFCNHYHVFVKFLYIIFQQYYENSDEGLASEQKTRGPWATIRSSESSRKHTYIILTPLNPTFI